MNHDIKRILLAEDNPADVYLIREALSVNGGADIEVVVVADGEEALDYVCHRNQHENSQAPDLIVLDLNLPKSDGGDVLKTIRGNSDMASIPVVVLTSSDSPKDRQAIEKLGADMYLTKPSELDAFLDIGSILLRLAQEKLNRADSKSA